MATLTDADIRSAKTDGKHLWLSDGGARGAGRLCVRVHANGRKSFYYRYTGRDGNRVSLPLGEYHPKSEQGGISLAEARRKAGDLARLHAEVTDVREHLEEKRREAVRARADAEEAEKRAIDEANRGTLRMLLQAYIDHLKSEQRPSARDVETCLQRHVLNDRSALADRKAAGIKVKDFRDLIADIVEKGKVREADKLRSHLIAAYNLALAAGQSATAGRRFDGFDIEVNPAASVASLAKKRKTRRRYLNTEELAAYLNALDGLPIATRLALELALYLAGQRPTQLLRVRQSDVDLTCAPPELVQYDPKGRRSEPREHLLPLVGRALEIVKELIKLNHGNTYLLGSVRASGAVSVMTLSTAVTDISTALVKDEVIDNPFQQRDIRRTAETHLSRMKFDEVTRAHLLSHGLGGVQNRHYNKYEYFDEKLAALKKWGRFLDGLRVQGVRRGPKPG
jgi:integrase